MEVCTQTDDTEGRRYSRYMDGNPERASSFPPTCIWNICFRHLSMSLTFKERSVADVVWSDEMTRETINKHMKLTKYYISGAKL